MTAPEAGVAPTVEPGERGAPRLPPEPGIGATLFESFRTLWANRLTFVGFVLVVFLSLTAFLVWFLPFVSTPLGHPVSIVPYNPNFPSGPANLPPGPQHWFGTNPVGYDVFSQVLTALPLDLGVSILITAASVAIGTALGLVSGFWDESLPGRILSGFILRVTDVFLAFPTLVFALAIATILGRTLETATVALVVTWWPYYVRLVRGEVLTIKHRGYIAAARALGVPGRTILRRHVLRNLLEPLVVYSTLDVGTVLVTFSTIAFVGISLPPSTPEWGTLIQEYQTYLANQAYLVLFPGLAIFVTVLALSLLGDGLQQVLDPRSRRTFARAPPQNLAPPRLTSGPAAPEA